MLRPVYRLLVNAVCGCGDRGCEQSACRCWRIYWYHESEVKEEIDNGRIELFYYGDDFYKQTVAPEDANWLPHPPMV